MSDGAAGTLETDQARVRLVLIRELETISVYEALARQAQSPDVRAFFEHLAAEEKEHVAEATWLLRQLDGDQEVHFQKAFSAAHFKGEAATVPAAEPGAGQSGAPEAPAPYIPEGHRLPSNPHATLYALPAPPSPTSGDFTVGPLKQRR